MASVTMSNSAYHERESHRQITPMAQIDTSTGYIANIDEIRQVEYPTLDGTTYLDHAGTTPYAKSLIEDYTRDLTSNLFGNPHSASSSSQLSTTRINNVRLQVLQFFHADPDRFDVVFVANATAAIKLVADAFRDSDDGFWFGYHADAHTSLVGVREYAQHGSRCFHTPTEIESWMAELRSSTVQVNSPPHRLFAYPGQSNMTGARHSRAWSRSLRKINEQPQTQPLGRLAGCKVFSLYDAAAMAATSPLDLSDVSAAPDFTALSFYKIFGFPDLGALIVRKDPAVNSIFGNRRYFGGGTVELVSPAGATRYHAQEGSSDSWHEKKETLHSMLEDGTSQFHNIIALDHAFKVHRRIYGKSGMITIAEHTRYLAYILYHELLALKHANGNRVCQLYSDLSATTDSGPTVAFNLKDSSGRWIGNSEIERLASVKNIQLRTGGLCNPGGIASHLDLSPEEMRQNFAAGQRCGGGNDIMNGRPTGAVRLSLGAMSSKADVKGFLDFLEEFFVDHTALAPWPSVTLSPPSPRERSSICEDLHKGKPRTNEPSAIPSFTIESLSVYPIKSCAAFQIPSSQSWEILSKGLAWDREWCLVHQGTNVALTQKQHPNMALLRPYLDLRQKKMIVWYRDESYVSISLDETGELVEGEMQTCANSGNRSRKRFKDISSLVCGEKVTVQLYTNTHISSFFTETLGVPCTLARYPTDSIDAIRHGTIRRPRSTRFSTPPPEDAPTRPDTNRPPPIRLSNESPILLVSRSSVNRLNEQIKAYASSRYTTTTNAITKLTPSTTPAPRTTVTPETFRPNIVIAQQDLPETPYLEDRFLSLTIRSSSLSVSAQANPKKTEIPASCRTASPVSSSSSTTTTTKLRSLGPCQRCQMVCIDQVTGTRSQEPFVTLAKTRRMGGGGGVWFGIHIVLGDDDDDDDGGDNDDGPEQEKKERSKRNWVRVGDTVVATLVGA